MPVPDFVLELRRHVGQAELWLPGITAVVRRGTGPELELLLVRRSDNGDWTPVTGIVDPGEDPGVAARREAQEEAGVEVSVDRLVSVLAQPPHVHVNGDRAIYLDHTFACTWLSGQAHPADDESTEVGWFRRDALPAMKPVMLDRIDAVLADDPLTRFRA